MMPRTLEPNDYDLFDFKHFDEDSLDLQQAVQEVRKRRALGRSGFVYRIVPIDLDAQKFRIEAIPVAQISEEIRLRMSDNWNRLVSRFRTLRMK